MVLFSHLIVFWRFYYHGYWKIASRLVVWWNLIYLSFINDLLKLLCTLWAQVCHDGCKKLFRNLDSFIVWLFSLAFIATYLLLLLPNRMSLNISSEVASLMCTNWFCLCLFAWWLSWNLMSFLFLKRWTRRLFKKWVLLWWWLLQITEFVVWIFLYLCLGCDFTLRLFFATILRCFLLIFYWIWAFSWILSFKMILCISHFCCSCRSK